MAVFSAVVDLNDRNLTEQRIDELMDALRAFEPSISQTERGWIRIHITVEAANITQATATAIAIAQQATNAPAIATEIMTELEAAARAGIPAPGPSESLSVTEASERLGLTRARINQLVKDGALAAEKVGNSYAIPRHAFRLYEAATQRVSTTRQPITHDIPYVVSPILNELSEGVGIWRAYLEAQKADNGEPHDVDAATAWHTAERAALARMTEAGYDIDAGERITLTRIRPNRRRTP